jgi:DNA polymerase V
VVVDRAIAPRHRSIVLASIDNASTSKRLKRWCGIMVLHDENLTLPLFMVSGGTEVVPEEGKH